MYKNLLKRVIDLGLSAIGFLILLPLFIIIYIVLIYSNKGKPIFLQPRPGKGERVFNIMKFKTMTDEKGEDGKLLPDDARLTIFGKFLRKTSLDEIPQLLNVIIGDMSLVGPRPLRVRYLPYYTEEESIRHTVRPGITGLAQVSGRNAIDWDNKLQKDIYYVKNLSLWLDIKILLKTIKKIFDQSDINLDNSEDALDTYRTLVNS